MSDDAEQTSTAPSPSPQLFGRPAAPADQRPADAASPEPATEPADAGDTDSRFPGTGDARVDRALAHLPDPDEHRQDAHADAASSIDLPDPGLLDTHIADVTSVHRQLQQRLSDLSG